MKGKFCVLINIKLLSCPFVVSSQIIHFHAAALVTCLWNRRLKLLTIILSVQYRKRQPSILIKQSLFSFKSLMLDIYVV